MYPPPPNPTLTPTLSLSLSLSPPLSPSLLAVVRPPALSDSWTQRAFRPLLDEVGLREEEKKLIIKCEIFHGDFLLLLFFLKNDVKDVAETAR